MPWTFKTIKKIKSGKSILIEGLPGMGNVGKIAIDFIIDDLKADKICDIVSPKLPHCVFVNEENLIELPSISMYHKKLKNKSLFLISGDTQPLDETSCHEFCNEVLSFCKKNSCEEIITLGGVGLQKEPPKPKIYLTSNSKNMLAKYNPSKKRKLNSIVGPIVGVSGLLVGLANNAKIPAVNIMAETFGHPNYMGVRGAKEILHVLEKKLSLGLNLKRLNKEADELQAISDSLEDAEYIDDAEEEHENNYFG